MLSYEEVSTSSVEYSYKKNVSACPTISYSFPHTQNNFIIRRFHGNFDNLPTIILTLITLRWNAEFYKSVYEINPFDS
jgi:hypothetical protein